MKAPRTLRLRVLLDWLWLPVLAAQGIRLRRTVPRLPEAAGPTCGEYDGDAPPLRLLVLGESTVAGVGAPDHEHALAGNTARALAQATGRAVQWRALGRNGATAASTRTELLDAATDVHADVVLMALGVNDTARLHGARRWRRDLRALIEAARARCGPVPVMLAGVPPMGHFPSLPWPTRAILGARARLLDTEARALTGTMAQVHYLPMPTELDAHFSEYFCEDGFHPGPAGYAVWGQALAAGVSPLV